jgi:heat shock protein HtpX
MGGDNSEMASPDSRDPFARRNRLRISVVVVLSIVNYWLAVCAAAVATGIIVVLWLASEGGFDDLRVIGVLLAVAIVIAIPVGSVIALVQVPLQRRRLERRVLAETGAVVADPSQHVEIRNLLDGLALAGGVPAPRFAVIPDPVPNAFGVGTKPEKAIVAVTAGLLHHLTRDETEAVLAYEVSRIRSWDVALSSWTVALTGGALDATGDDGLKSIIGWLPRRFAERLQVWALRDLGTERDKAAVRFTRHPKALLRALEKLHANPAEVTLVSRATAPLWVEVPVAVLRATTSPKRAARLIAELDLGDRIAALRAMVGAPPGPLPAPAPPSPKNVPTAVTMTENGTGFGASVPPPPSPPPQAPGAPPPPPPPPGQPPTTIIT